MYFCNNCTMKNFYLLVVTHMINFQMEILADRNICRYVYETELKYLYQKIHAAIIFSMLYVRVHSKKTLKIVVVWPILACFSAILLLE